MQKLIILRGNSGSGKSTVAKALRKKMGYQTMLIQQDVIRREILRVQDLPGNPSMQLIYDLAMYGKNIGYDVVIEGILHADKCSEMLRKLISEFGDERHVYYFDIPFEETLRRHSTKSKEKSEFGADEMRSWWREKDFLGVNGEKTISEKLSMHETVDYIYRDSTKSESLSATHEQTNP